MSDPKPKTIRVRIGESRKGDRRVILNDQDERHPGGHVLIRGDDERKTITVGDTPRVRELVEQGLLEVVGESAEKGDAAGTTKA